MPEHFARPLLEEGDVNRASHVIQQRQKYQRRNDGRPFELPQAHNPSLLDFQGGLIGTPPDTART